MSLARKEIFEFGEFRLDVDEHTIERLAGVQNGTLTEKAFQALVLLVRRRGHLVSKDELIQFIWPDTIVEENNLEKCIHHLRHFLGETPDRTGYIETIRKHGYRFVGRVHIVEVSQSWLPETLRQPDEETHPTEANGHPARTNVNVERPNNNKTRDAALPEVFHSKKVVAAALVVGAVVIASVLGYLGFVRTSTADTPRSIVVLPVAPINTVDSNVLYEIGITDSLIDRLASAEGLTVRPLSSVRDYVGQRVDPITAGREQKVDYVLESNYQIVNGRIKVTGRLYDVASGKVEDTFRVEQDIANVFGAQDAIAALFGSQLMSRFGAKPGGSLAKRGTDNEEAYKLYQQAINLIDRRRPENSKKALDYLDQVVALDPNYAQAWAGKAEAIWTSGQRDENQIHEAIQKALAIDPSLSDAHSALCTDKLLYHYDFGEAEAACKHAIDLDPSSSAAHRAYSWVLSFHGQHDRALAEIRTAIDLEPVSYINKRDLGNALYLARNYGEAAAQWRRLVELDPADPVVYNQLIRTLEAQGKDEEAFEWFIKLLNVRQRDEHAIAQYQAAYQTSGWRGVLLERAIDPNIGFGYPTDFHIACLYARAGEKDKAFQHLERSFQQREWAMPQLQVHPQLDSIRDDPRFQELADRVENN